MKKVLTCLSFAILIIVLIIAWVLRFRYPYLTDIQFLMEFWYLYVLALVGIAFYAFGKGMSEK